VFCPCHKRKLHARKGHILSYSEKDSGLRPFVAEPCLEARLTHFFVEEFRKTGLMIHLSAHVSLQSAKPAVGLLRTGGLLTWALTNGVDMDFRDRTGED
jgi:hypothetical protein